MSSSSSGARLGSGDSPRTLFFQQLTPPPRAATSLSLSCPPPLSTNRRFFFFFFLLRPLRRQTAQPLSALPFLIHALLLLSLSLSFPIRSFLTSLRSVLSMSVHFFFFLRSLCLCQAARFLRPAPLNPQGPLVDEGRFARFEYESCNYNRG